MSNLERHDILEVEEIFQIISINTLLLQAVTLRPWGDLPNPVFLVCRSQGMESGRGDRYVCEGGDGGELGSLGKQEEAM